MAPETSKLQWLGVVYTDAGVTVLHVVDRLSYSKCTIQYLFVSCQLYLLTSQAKYQKLLKPVATAYNLANRQACIFILSLLFV